jgi:sarcosine oxidase subunit delta
VLEIPCPYCGRRAHTEFTYMGDATVSRPADGPEASDRDWYEFVYVRLNPKGPHKELWHHTNGCRVVFEVSRDTATHEITGSAKLSDEGGAAS